MSHSLTPVPRYSRWVNLTSTIQMMQTTHLNVFSNSESALNFQVKQEQESSSHVELTSACINSWKESVSFLSKEEWDQSLSRLGVLLKLFLIKPVVAEKSRRSFRDKDGRLLFQVSSCIHAPVMVMSSRTDEAERKHGEWKCWKGPGRYSVAKPLHNLTKVVGTRHIFKKSSCR